MIRLIKILAIGFIGLLMTLPCVARTVTLGWTAPVDNEDGTTLTDLKGFNIYFQTDTNYVAGENIYTSLVDGVIAAPQPDANGKGEQYQISFDTDTNHWAAVTAFDFAGNESDFSEGAWVDVIDPLAPTNLYLDWDIMTYQYIYLEAEDMPITSGMAIFPDVEAYNGSFIATTSSTVSESTALFTFNIETDGNYYLWARTKSEGPNFGARNSFYLSVNSSSNDVWDTFIEPYDAVRDTWTWDYVSLRCGSTFETNGCDPYVVHLLSGPNNILISGREYMTQLDAMWITNDPAFVGEDPSIIEIIP